MLYVSGYTTDELLEPGGLPPRTAFLTKPFTRATLAAEIGSVIASDLTPSPISRRVQRDRARRRDVERLGGAREGNRHAKLAGRLDLGGKTPPLGAEHDRDRTGEIDIRERLTTVGDERNASSRELVPADQRDAEDRSGRGAQRLRRERVGALGRERDARVERVRGADQRADVARIGQPPEPEAALANTGGRSARR